MGIRDDWTQFARACNLCISSRVLIVYICLSLALSFRLFIVSIQTTFPYLTSIDGPRKPKPKKSQLAQHNTPFQPQKQKPNKFQLAKHSTPLQSPTPTTILSNLHSPKTLPPTLTTRSPKPCALFFLFLFFFLSLRLSLSRSPTPAVTRSQVRG